MCKSVSFGISGLQKKLGGSESIDFPLTVFGIVDGYTFLSSLLLLLFSPLLIFISIKRLN